METKNSTSASEVAKYIISRFYEEEIDEGVSESVSNLKLQKLLFFCQAFSLARLDRPMFDEKAYAWKYGPVIKKVYDEYKIYGNEPIPEDGDHQKTSASITDEDKKIIDEVLKVFGQYSAVRLMGVTHSHKPWLNLEKKVNSGEKNIEITQEAMKKYYQPLLKKDDSD